MSTIVMFWDQIHPSTGDTIAGIEIYGNHLVEIPDNACGFRLGLPGQPWHEGWHFAEKGLLGSPFTFQGITYSSSFTGTPSPDAIVARGPVHACTGGLYNFVTPLGQFGITGDAPVIAGAGSFVADFSTEEDIEWLDHAEQPIKKPKIEPEPKPPKLPKEFFEKPPEVKGCFRDFDDKLHCPDDDSAGAAPRGGTIGSLVSGTAAPQLTPLLAEDGGFVPHLSSVPAPTGTTATVSGSGKIELPCPAELVLTATFHKDHTFDPATVEYRFRFAHGPISTVFATHVSGAGGNSVHHSVPIPLPPPLGQGSGAGGVGLGASGLAIPQKPEEPINPGGIPPVPGGPTITTTPLPSNEHRSSVRVEVLNAEGGIIASPWARYHLVCAQGSPPRPGTAIREFQARRNKTRR